MAIAPYPALLPAVNDGVSTPENADDSQTGCLNRPTILAFLVAQLTR